jgi:hypothetical protein
LAHQAVVAVAAALVALRPAAAAVVLLPLDEVVRAALRAARLPAATTWLRRVLAALLVAALRLQVAALPAVVAAPVEAPLRRRSSSAEMARTTI